jgi:phenylpropionate dioxygenase-like ring-hydroxylating dioxygenase large terminal subunit
MNDLQDFKFTPTDKAPDPDLGTARIPVDRYTEPRFLKLEDEHIWSKTWLLAGAACDVAEPGDYFVFNNLRESILVTRTVRSTPSTTSASIEEID